MKHQSSSIQNIVDTALREQARAGEALRAASPALEKAYQQIIQSYTKKGKVLACGNGGSAGDAQHLASELINRYRVDRKALAAVALTPDALVTSAIANDSDFRYVYARQLSALLSRDDTVVLFTTSGNSVNLLEATKEAHAIGARVVAFTGREGGALAQALREDDIEVRIAAESTARIQEMHLTCIHIICQAVEEWLAESGL